MPLLLPAATMTMSEPLKTALITAPPPVEPNCRSPAITALTERVAPPPTTMDSVSMSDFLKKPFSSAIHTGLLDKLIAEKPTRTLSAACAWNPPMTEQVKFNPNKIRKNDEVVLLLMDERLLKAVWRYLASLAVTRFERCLVGAGHRPVGQQLTKSLHGVFQSELRQQIPNHRRIAGNNRHTQSIFQPL